jgi:flagellar basal-body rod protein FlgF
VPGISEIAATMMIGAEQRIDAAASNVSNINTPGYRSRRVFADTLDARSGLPVSQVVLSNSNKSLALTQTGQPFDFATDGEAMLAMRSTNGVTFSRTAQLRRDADGRLIDGQGRVLLGEDGSELVVTPGNTVVTTDGTVLVEGQPQGRLGLFDPVAAKSNRLEPAQLGTVRQGMVVGSDVELGDEMLEINKASRMAEAGARLFQVWDDLTGKAASQLGSISK